MSRAFLLDHMSERDALLEASAQLVESSPERAFRAPAASLSPALAQDKSSFILACCVLYAEGGPQRPPNLEQSALWSVCRGLTRADIPPHARSHS